MLNFARKGLSNELQPGPVSLKVTSDRNANFDKLQAETKPDPERGPADVRGGKALEVDI